MTPHSYEADPQSGAGNCTCGAAPEHRRHPHNYRQAANRTSCVCAMPAGHPIHTDNTTTRPNPVKTGPERVAAAIERDRDSRAPSRHVLFASTEEGQ